MNDFKSKGNTMRQRALTFWGRQSILKGPAAEDDTAVSLTNGPSQALCDSKPPRFINGFIRHGCKGKSTNTSTVKVKKKKIRWCQTGEGGDSDGVSANGTKEDKKVLPRPNVSSACMKQRGEKKLKDKMWEARKACQENPTPVQEEEDWESEIQDVTIPDWQKMHFGNIPYGSEDLLHFSLRGLKLNPKDLLFQRVGYWPGKHHPEPFFWRSYSSFIEPGQFADAQEEASDSFIVKERRVNKQMFFPMKFKK